MTTCGYANCKVRLNNDNKLSLKNEDTNQIKCEHCKQVSYHSETCKTIDWERYHQYTCQNFKRSTFAAIEFRCIKNEEECKKKFANIKQTGAYLGKGGYGYVVTIIDKSSDELKAMKVINKNFVGQNGGMSQLHSEVELQQSVSHNNIIKLHDIFTDNTNVYLIMDYASNKDFKILLKNKKKLCEQEAFKYWIQAVRAVQALQIGNVIHRDIKPENQLLDKDWNVKLCDFGCASKVVENYRNPYIGTTEYMAPEIQTQQKYGLPVDIWSLGVVLFELVHGFKPFNSKKESVLINSIVKCNNIPCATNLSNECKDLLTRQLSRNPNTRLTINSILTHPWVTRGGYSVDYTELYKKYDKRNSDIKIQNDKVKYNNLAIPNQDYTNPNNSENNNPKKSFWQRLNLFCGADIRQKKPKK